MEFLGKTVEQAIEDGLATLNIKKEDAVITILEEGEQGGFLGLGGKKAKVNIEVKQKDSEKAIKFLEGLFKVLNIPATLDVIEDGDKLLIDIISTTSSKLIGYRGEVLDAIQTLTSALCNYKNDNYKKVVVDCENYRDKRKATLISLAIRLADKAIKLGRKVNLEPMNPYERRIIHSALSEYEGVKTESEGEEPNRRIVIIPDNLKPYEEKKGFNKGKFNKNNRQDKGEVIKTTKKTSGFGTYLGNSLKNDD